MDGQNELQNLAKDLILDTKTDITKEKKISIPIAQLSTLGAGVSSLIPALHTVTQTSTVNTGGLYKLLNGEGVGLKQSRSGFLWGATKESKMGKFQELNSATKTTTTQIPIDPTTMMMAVALASIEKQLGDIAEMQKQILSFLETEKESDVEGDVETLSKIINDYKYNWDNELFVNSNHKLVLDIRRNANKNIKSYNKRIEEVIDSKDFLISQSNVSSALEKLTKDFKYYRLSLFSYSLSSLLEIMLSGNFKEEYISGIRDKIKQLSDNYRDLHTKCSVYLEKISKSSIETNVLKGLGAVTKSIGGFIGSIPFVKEGPVDEFLIESGDSLTENAGNMEEEKVKEFGKINNPNTVVFMDRMDEIIKIYNHTTDICFDENNIYLLTE